MLRAVFSVGSGETARILALVAEGAPLLPQDADFELDRALAAIARIQTGFLRGIEHALAAAEDALALFTAMGLEVGQDVTVEVHRGGETKEIEVKLGERPLSAPSGG